MTLKLKHAIYFIAGLSLLSFLPQNVYAQNEKPFDSSTIFCEKMDNKKLYSKNHFGSYKYLFPGTDGWIFRSESDLRQDFSLDEKAISNLTRLNQGFENQGSKLIIFFMPTRAMMHGNHIPENIKKEYGYDRDRAWRSYKKAAASMEEIGIEVITIDRPQKEISFFYKRDHHWNPNGAKLAAQKVAQYIKAQPGYNTLNKKEYGTRLGKEYEFVGVSKKVFNKLCDTDQPPEYTHYRITQAVDEKSEASDLFGEATIPEVTLLGTSNSTQIPSQANFEGYLKEALSLDVLNMSKSGGGLDTAMLTYLKSEFFNENPSKYVLWEIPSYYDISNHRQFFRSALPLLLEKCTQENAMLSKEVEITETSQLVFNKLTEKQMTGSDYTISVSFDSIISEPFQLDLRYEGNRDRFRFKPWKTEKQGTPYKMSLNENKTEYLDKIVLWSPNSNIGKTARISVCKNTGPKTENEAELKSASSVQSVWDKVKNIMN
ncbi:MAG: alginate O-acetyltransferase AlgX-related protein [Alphaproteobacteria bacterium]